MSDLQPWQYRSFYRFVPLADPGAMAAALRRIAPAGLGGSVVVANEGLSGAVAGPAAAVAGFEAALQTEPAFGGAFAGLGFKPSTGRTAPFARLSIVVKPELVALGLPGVSGLVPGMVPGADAGADAGAAAPGVTVCDPAAWHALLQRQDLVLIDNRNRFEHRLGRFRGAVAAPVDLFRDFGPWVLAQAEGWRREDRTVAMYCTGGIRCDKTAAWMAGLGLKVATLDGGIVGYLAQPPAAETAANGRDAAWQGECFVFDNRIALDARLRETTTTATQVYDPAVPGEAWRLARARRLADSVTADEPTDTPAAP